MSDNGIGPYLAEFKRHNFGPWTKPPKKIKFTQPLWCEVCKINCNSRDAYIAHISGKKHMKNQETLSKPLIAAAGSPMSVESSNALQCAANPVIGPPEKPNILKLDKVVTLEDVELKRRKLVEGGVTANAIKLCTLCNVVCNSQTVFNFHLTGQKHAAMVKKQAESTNC